MVRQGDWAESDNVAHVQRKTLKNVQKALEKKGESQAALKQNIRDGPKHLYITVYLTVVYCLVVVVFFFAFLHWTIGVTH